MADQKTITLRQGSGTARNIILYPLPQRDVITTTIYLYQGHATPSTITLRDPTASAAPPATLSLAAAQVLDSLQQTATVSSPTIIAATAAQTLDDLTQSATVTDIIAISAAQSLSGVVQSGVFEVVVVATATQTLDAVGQTAVAIAVVGTSAGQTLAALAQTATAEAIAALTSERTLDGLTQDATVSSATAVLSIEGNQALDGVIQVAALSGEVETMASTGGGGSGPAPSRHRAFRDPVSEDQQQRRRDALKRIDALIDETVEQVEAKAEQARQPVPETFTARVADVRQQVEQTQEAPADEVSLSRLKREIAALERHARVVAYLIERAEEEDDDDALALMVA